MVDLKRLSYFVEIAEQGSLSKASRTLHIAQPALSRQVHILEDYLGFQLFERSSQGMRLTPDGKSFRNAVTGPLRDLELVVQNVRSFTSRVEWNFALGFHSGIGPSISGPLIRELHDRFPDVKFRVVEGHSISQIDWLERAVIDFAFLDCPVPDGHLSNRLLASEKLLLVTPVDKDDRWEGAVTFSDIAPLPLVLPCQYHGVRKAVDDAAANARLSLNIQYEVDSLSLTTNMVKEHGMYTVLSESLAKTLSGLKTRSIVDPELEIGLYLGTRNFENLDGSIIAEINNFIQEIIIDLLRSKICPPPLSRTSKNDKQR